MSCQHKNITRQSFDMFGKHLTVTFCRDCTNVIDAVDEKGQPWTVPRTKQEIGERVKNVAAGMLERFAKKLRPPDK